MNSTMVPIRVLVLVGTSLTICLFLFGILHWNAKKQVCFDGNRWYGDWYVAYSVGKLELRQKQYGCPASDQYDPNQFKKDKLVP